MSQYFCLRETAELAAFIAGAEALPPECIDVSESLGRVLAADLHAPFPSPGVSRSIRDGYAVRAADVAAARPDAPVILRLAGECRMGADCAATLRPGEAWRVYTGSATPEGADAVVMQEDAKPLAMPSASCGQAAAVAIGKPGATGQYLLARGADMPEGALLARAGTTLGAHHLALLTQFFQQLPVHRQAVLGVLATGDEFCLPGQANMPSANQISSNALLLQGIAATFGARCLHLGTVPDNPQAICQGLLAALPGGSTPCDVIAVIGGSSGGRRDFSAQAIASLPGCRVCGHDQRVSSGRPLTLARVERTSIWGLPGHALSLALTAQVFLAPLLQRLAGRQTVLHTGHAGQYVMARLGLPLPAEGIAPTHYPVMLRRDRGRTTAWPVAAGTGKTAVLRDMHGWLTMPGCPDADGDAPKVGLRRGAAVRVRLFV